MTVSSPSIFCKTPKALKFPEVSLGSNKPPASANRLQAAKEGLNSSFEAEMTCTLKDLMNISIGEDAIEILDGMDSQKAEKFLEKFNSKNAIQREGFNDWRSRVSKIQAPGPIPPDMLFSLEDMKANALANSNLKPKSENGNDSETTSQGPSELSAGEAPKSPEKVKEGEEPNWGPEGRPRWVPKNGKQDPTKKPHPFTGRQMVFLKNTKTVFRKDAIWTVVGESGSGRSWRVDPASGFGNHLEEKWKAIGATVPKKKEGQLWRWKESTQAWMTSQGLPMSLLEQPRNTRDSKPFSNQFQGNARFNMHGHGGNMPQNGFQHPGFKPMRTSTPSFTPGATANMGTFNRPQMPKVAPKPPSFAAALANKISNQRAPSSPLRNPSSPLRTSNTGSDTSTSNMQQARELRVMRMMMEEQDRERQQDRMEMERLRHQLQQARNEIERLRRTPRTSGSPGLRSPVVRRPSGMTPQNPVIKVEGKDVYTGPALAWAPTRNTPEKQNRWEMWGAKRLGARGRN